MKSAVKDENDGKSMQLKRRSSNGADDGAGFEETLFSFVPQPLFGPGGREPFAKDQKHALSEMKTKKKSSCER